MCLCFCINGIDPVYALRKMFRASIQREWQVGYALVKRKFSVFFEYILEKLVARRS